LPALVASDTANAVITIGTLSATIMNVAGAATATSGKIKVNVVIPAGAAAGTYAYKFTPTVQGGGTLNSAAVTFTVTVTAAPADDLVASAAKTTSIIQTGETVTSGSLADSATVIVKTAAPTAQAATILVSVKNAAGTTLTQPALTVLVKAGTPGTVGSAAVGATTSMTSSGRAMTTTAGDLIGVFADGTEGVSEIEIYAGTILLATEKVTFYGTTTAYAGTLAVKVIPVGDTATITVTGADKAAIATAAPTVYAISSDSTVATVPATIGAAGSIVVTAVKSGKATITLCDTAACTAATITKTVAIQVGAKTATSVKLTFDVLEPTAGQKVTATLTALDALGNAVGDGVRSLMSAAGFTSSIAVSGSTLPTVDTVTLSAGVATYIFYAPSAGTVTFTATEGTATDSTTKGTITGSVTVANPGLDAATVAAEAAEAAAQDATDAALDATTAAEAAGALAQEAVDLVTELSAQVTKLMDALKAQIDSLTKLVLKMAITVAKVAAKK
jgi:hypothetical protein